MMLVVLSWFSNHGNSLLPKLDADILQANAQIIKMTEEIENTYLAARLILAEPAICVNE